MAEIIQNEGGGHKGKRRPKKHSTHIDMTPMVDLACLLLTFFMLTTAFSKPKAMEIVLPDKDKKDDKDAPKVQDERVLNIIMDENDKVYYYNGMADPKKPLPTLVESDYSKDGIRKVLLNRNKDLFVKLRDLDEEIAKSKKNIPRDTVNKMIRDLKRKDNDAKKGPVVLIKATDKSKYKNMVDIMDEMAITNIAVYAIVDMTKEEQKLLDAKKGTVTAKK
jgi:biopolymer transport protein ExbD